MSEPKLCACGCGQPTKFARQTVSKRGLVKGQPLRFVAGHFAPPHPSGSAHPRWNGGKKVDTNGYVHIYAMGHPRADQHGCVYEHILIAEHALGRPLPVGVEVHHVNEEHGDNRNTNLVICEDHEYHFLLHVRRRALLAGCPPHWMKCTRCLQYDDPLHMNRYHNASMHRMRKGVCDVA